MEAAGNNQADFPEANGYLHPMISFPLTVPDDVLLRHTHSVRADQACSVVVQTVNAPIETVWSIVRRFDNPQAYRRFVNSCRIISGDGRLGTIREVEVLTSTSIQRLDILDEENHVISFRIVGGNHWFLDYRSVTTLHPTEDGNGTVVVESYVVDVVEGNTKEETCFVADNFIRIELQSLDRVAQNLYRSRAQGPQM